MLFPINNSPLIHCYFVSENTGIYVLFYILFLLTFPTRGSSAAERVIIAMHSHVV